MNKLSIKITAIAFSVIIVVVFVFAQSLRAEVMSSSNYKMESDSVNFAGGHGSSSLYSIEDTLGEQATGYSSSTNYTMSAGYQQFSQVLFSVVPATNVVMSPGIDGALGGISVGATQFSVSTNNSSGYSVTIYAEGSPALRSSSGSFDDYVPSGSDADIAFVNSTASSSFGFSPAGLDIYSRYTNDGASCGTGSDTSGGCWDGLSVSPKMIVSRATPNNPSGSVTALNFRAESGSVRNQPAGTYVATTTLTVLPL